MPRRALRGAAAVLAGATLTVCVALSGCGSGSTASRARSRAARGLPGSGKPAIVVGDKNFTEQFLLGELYKQALQAQGYDVSLNRNIGPTEVTIAALESGRVDVYPEYLRIWTNEVAGLQRRFVTRRAAYAAGERYAASRGLRLLSPTPFGDTDAIAVTRAYAAAHRLRALGDLRRVAASLNLGAPPQFQVDDPGLPALHEAYGFAPAQFTPLAIGTQYAALDQGKVQAADVNTTDAQLGAGRYAVLADRQRVFGWGNVVPVVSERTVLAEGPAFTHTINRVNALLSLDVMRRLNAAVDLSGLSPATVAEQFLRAHRVLSAGSA